MTQHQLHLLCLLAVALGDPAPAPGRVPKVYNALITSNQNLEPSKAFPVYQPVLHDTAFTYPFSPAIYYGDFPLSNSLQPGLPLLPRDPNVKDLPPASEATSMQPAPPADVAAESPSSENPPPQPSVAPNDANGQATPAPPLPPNTQSPIPLNEFGLPPQVLPLGRFDPAYQGFTQVGPFTYPYPGLRFYDPYDPFSLNPFANLPPLYRTLPNYLGTSAVGPEQPAQRAPTPAPAPAPTEQSVGGIPPAEPGNLNVLNYASKDPAIPNVPPPPLPQGGLKTSDAE